MAPKVHDGGAAPVKEIDSSLRVAPAKLGKYGGAVQRRYFTSVVVSFDGDQLELAKAAGFRTILPS